MRFILIAVVLLVVVAFLAKRKTPVFISNPGGGNELPGSPMFGPYQEPAAYA